MGKVCVLDLSCQVEQTQDTDNAWGMAKRLWDLNYITVRTDIYTNCCGNFDMQ